MSTMKNSGRLSKLLRAGMLLPIAAILLTLGTSSLVLCVRSYVGLGGQLFATNLFESIRIDSLYGYVEIKWDRNRNYSLPDGHKKWSLSFDNETSRFLDDDWNKSSTLDTFYFRFAGVKLDNYELPPNSDFGQKFPTGRTEAILPYWLVCFTLLIFPVAYLPSKLMTVYRLQIRGRRGFSAEI